MDPTATPNPTPTEPELTAQIDTMMATSSTGAKPAPPAPAEPVPAPPPPTAVVGSDTPEVVTPLAPHTPKRAWQRPALLIAAAVVLLAAIVGAAYAEVIVPNKPQNVLMSALENSAQAPQVSYKGSIDADSGGMAVKVALNGAQDAVKSAADIQLNVTASGISLPFEARLVDKNAYIKVGDLSSITSLISAYGGSKTGALVASVSKQLSNKWISIDSTLLKQVGVSCLTDTSFRLTPADTKLIEDQYRQHPFATITSSASDSVDGKKVTKYELSIDDDTAAVFGNNMSLQSCDKKAITGATNAKGDHKKTPLTVWIDKGSKHIVQVGFSTPDKIGKASGKVSFKYEPVSVSAPSDSTPALEILAKLQQSLGASSAASGLDLTSLLGGLSQ